MKKIRVAVVGCKNMGSKHVKCLLNKFSGDVKIAGILNSTPQSSAAKAEELGVPYFERLADISKRNTDAVIISTPAENHFETARYVIGKGIPCLIEKPFASNEEECLELMKLAETQGVPIMVGHTENYNPAVVRLKELLTGRQVISIAAIRTSANPGVKQTHIISELMIHDLAIVNSFLGSDFETAIVSKDDKYRWDEQAVAEMRYWNKAIVRLEAVRADVPIERHMRVIDDKQNIYQIDFPARKLLKNGEPVTEGGDSLAAELGNFIGVLHGNESPLISLEEAKENVGLCNQLEKISGAERNFQKNMNRSCIGQVSSLYKQVER